MARLITALLVLGALASSAGAATPERVLAVEYGDRGASLRWLTAERLRPAGPPALALGRLGGSTVAVSPDRRLAAVAGAGGRLHVVELDRLRVQGTLRLGTGHVTAAVWRRPDRLLVLAHGDPAQAVVVDPLRREVVTRCELPAAVGARLAERRLLLLVSARERIGEARLAVVEADCSVATIALPGIRAGFEPPRESEAPGRYASPGLALSADDARVAVVGHDRIALLDLRTRELRFTPLALRTPARTLKTSEGWGRTAVWATPDTLAITGWSESWTGRTRHHARFGARLVDLRTGEHRTLDETATEVRRVGATLLASGGSALRAFRLDGTPLFELLRGHDTGYLQLVGRRAYVGGDNSTRFTVVDVRAGKVLRTARTQKPTAFFAP